MKKFVTACIIAFLCLAPVSAWAQEDGILRILAIGNSFSADAVEQHLYDIAAAGGQKMIIGNMYIGGCSLEKHWNNAKNDKAAYKYRKIDLDGKLTVVEGFTLSRGLMDEEWDIVTFQQQSSRSGIFNMGAVSA